MCKNCCVSYLVMVAMLCCLPCITSTHLHQVHMIVPCVQCAWPVYSVPCMQCVHPLECLVVLLLAIATAKSLSPALVSSLVPTRSAAAYML